MKTQRASTGFFVTRITGQDSCRPVNQSQSDPWRFFLLLKNLPDVHKLAPEAANRAVHGRIPIQSNAAQTIRKKLPRRSYWTLA